jgi:hypothetical protein
LDLRGMRADLEVEVEVQVVQKEEVEEVATLVV